jgi:hypothetical protein
MLAKLTTAKARQYLYALATALLALLVGYDIIAADQVPLWLGFVAALFAIGATSTATLVVRSQRKDGTLE